MPENDYLDEFEAYKAICNQEWNSPYLKGWGIDKKKQPFEMLTMMNRIVLINRFMDIQAAGLGFIKLSFEEMEQILPPILGLNDNLMVPEQYKKAIEAMFEIYRTDIFDKSLYEDIKEEIEEPKLEIDEKEVEIMEVFKEENNSEHKFSKIFKSGKEHDNNVESMQVQLNKIANMKLSEEQMNSNSRIIKVDTFESNMEQSSVQSDIPTPIKIEIPNSKHLVSSETSSVDMIIYKAKFREINSIVDEIENRSKNMTINDIKDILCVLYNYHSSLSECDTTNIYITSSISKIENIYSKLRNKFRFTLLTDILAFSKKLDEYSSLFQTFGLNDLMNDRDEINSINDNLSNDVFDYFFEDEELMKHMSNLSFKVKMITHRIDEKVPMPVEFYKK